MWDLNLGLSLAKLPVGRSNLVCSILCPLQDDELTEETVLAAMVADYQGDHALNMILIVL